LILCRSYEIDDCPILMPFYYSSSILVNTQEDDPFVRSPEGASHSLGSDELKISKEHSDKAQSNSL
jgi:hypothetical protein